MLRTQHLGASARSQLPYALVIPAFLCASPAAGLAQEITSDQPIIANSVVELEPIVFSPLRGIETPISRAGSSVSVVTREDIDRAGVASVPELLRGVPGVSFTTNGGFGSTSNVRIRGAESQHTMVLIDGVPVSDPTDTRSQFDLRTLSPTIIERIEVLRGPQSALYGSDAIGGVINIITRQATDGPIAELTLEGGSDSFNRQTGTFGNSAHGFSILGSVSRLDTDGFSRTQVDKEDDGVSQLNGFLRGTAELNEDARIDAQIRGSDTETEYDRAPTSSFGGQDRERQMRTADGFIRGQYDTFEDRWIHTVTASASRSDNVDDDGRNITDYVGKRYGVEYTGEIDLSAFGTLLVGGGVERLTAEQARRNSTLSAYDGAETYWSLFAIHQALIGEALSVSVAARVDDFDDAGLYATGRVTALYDIFATDTQIHGSIGTGAKAPTLYQRFGPFGAVPDLKTEESWGADLGVRQTFFGGAVFMDVTGFYNRFDNLIDFRGGFFDGEFVNVAKAETYGVEVSADASVIPGVLDASASYTYLQAEDLETGNRLRRRPEHEGSVSLTYLGVDGLTLSATAFFVAGDRFSDDDNLLRLNDYVRVDLTGSYDVKQNLEIFGRVENLFDAHYEEIDGYNTPGLSAYVGVRAKI
ncbi:MAG: TonB-dependent receptor [Pseudomonadota bacterium]